jgi:DNA-binding NarL/FixJ family response regulator
MKVSDDTVASHVKEIFRRLAVRNRTEAVVRFLQRLAPGA